MIEPLLGVAHEPAGLLVLGLLEASEPLGGLVLGVGARVAIAHDPGKKEKTT